MNINLPNKLACAAIVAAAVFSGCSKNPSGEVLARVGDKEITVADFKAEYERRQANRQPLPDRQVLLDQLVDREVMLQQAKAADLNNAADVRRACEDILIAKFKDTELAPKLAAVAKVSPDEIRVTYEKENARYTQPAKVKLAFVIIAVDPKANTNQVAAAAARAEDAQRLAVALPPDTRGFGQVAADFSDDQLTRYRGGDAGWFAADGLAERWPKEILAAGFALRNSGEISGVLRGQNGFYFVKKLDTRAASVTPLEQVRTTIEHQLLVAKQQKREQELKSQMRSAAKVVTDGALLANVFYPTQNQSKPVSASPPKLSSSP